MAISRYVLAVVGDLHVGSTVGLCPPGGIAVEDGGLYRPSIDQRWIWDAAWSPFWAEVSAARKNAHLSIVVNGEPIDGNHHGTTQIVSPDLDIQAAAAIEALLTIRGTADDFFMVRGTAAHGRAEEKVARELSATRNPAGGHAFYHLDLHLGGVSFNIAHHVGGDGVPWSRGNAIRREVMDHLEECAAQNVPPANVLIRGHVHKVSDTGVNFSTYGVVAPAWQLKTEYVHRISRRRYAAVGGLIFIIENGRLVEKRIRTWTRRLTTTQIR